MDCRKDATQTLHTLYDFHSASLCVLGLLGCTCTAKSAYFLLAALAHSSCSRQAASWVADLCQGRCTKHKALKAQAGGSVTACPSCVSSSNAQPFMQTAQGLPAQQIQMCESNDLGTVSVTVERDRPHNQTEGVAQLVHVNAEDCHV